MAAAAESTHPCRQGARIAVVLVREPVPRCAPKNDNISAPFITHPGAETFYQKGIREAMGQAGQDDPSLAFGQVQAWAQAGPCPELGPGRTGPGTKPGPVPKPSATHP